MKEKIRYNGNFLNNQRYVMDDILINKVLQKHLREEKNIFYFGFIYNIGWIAISILFLINFNDYFLYIILIFIDLVSIFFFISAYKKYNYIANNLYESKIFRKKVMKNIRLEDYKLIKK